MFYITVLQTYTVVCCTIVYCIVPLLYVVLLCYTILHYTLQYYIISTYAICRCGNGALICYWQYQYMMIGPDKDVDTYLLTRKIVYVAIVYLFWDIWDLPAVLIRPFPGCDQVTACHIARKSECGKCLDSVPSFIFLCFVQDIFNFLNICYSCSWRWCLPGAWDWRHQNSE
jgi:hypothetical protein